MTTSPTDKEVGQVWAGFMLAQLFEKWPRRCDFDIETISSATSARPALDAEEMFDDLTEWLRSNGFINFNQDGEGLVFGVSLTTAGLDLLGRQLDVGGRTFGARLKETVADAGSEAGRAAIGEIVGQIFGALARGFVG